MRALIQLHPRIILRTAMVSGRVYYPPRGYFHYIHILSYCTFSSEIPYSRRLPILVLTLSITLTSSRDNGDDNTRPSTQPVCGLGHWLTAGGIASRGSLALESFRVLRNFEVYHASLSVAANHVNTLPFSLEPPPTTLYLFSINLILLSYILLKVRKPLV